MTDTSTTSIDLDLLKTHLDSNTLISDELQRDIDPVVTTESAVIAASGSYAQRAAAAELPAILEAWRANGAKLQTIYDILIADGGTGMVRLDTQNLRDDVADANGIDNRGSFEIRDDGIDYVIDGRGGNDTIVVDQNSDGTVDITVNRIVVTLTAEQAEHLLIEGGSGNDTITVNPYSTPQVMGPGGFGMNDPAATTPIGFRINGGSGDDIITGGNGADIIDGGAGRDYIDGGRGDDRVKGGSGFDTIYGGRGDDRLEGGDDNDYIDGGRGDDWVNGNDGDDIVAGGHGDDTLYGMAGNDVIIGGTGVDTIRDRTTGDSDVVYAEAQDNVALDTVSTANYEPTEIDETLGENINIEGSSEFVDRVESDLAVLAAIPTSAAVLQSIDENSGDHTITIRLSASGDNEASTTGDGDPWEGGDGKSGFVDYNPTNSQIGTDETWQTRPPIVGLEHELLHGDDYVNGELDPGRSEQVAHDNGTPTVDRNGDRVQATDSNGDPVDPKNNRELSVTGLPFDEDDTDASATAATSGINEVDANNREHTENTFREALGLDSRDHY